MRRLRLSIAAERDLGAIFADSEDRFGAEVADRYRRLVSAALRDLREDVDRAGVKTFENDVRAYHLRHSRRRLAERRSVARPRHLLAFRIVAEEIEVLRVLHDAMDLTTRLGEL